jgi:hypothetical protein
LRFSHQDQLQAHQLLFAAESDQLALNQQHSLLEVHQVIGANINRKEVSQINHQKLSFKLLVYFSSQNHPQRFIAIVKQTTLRMAMDRGAHELLQAESQLLNNIILYLKRTISKHFLFEFTAISDDVAVILLIFHRSFVLLGKCAEVRI